MKLTLQEFRQMALIDAQLELRLASGTLETGRLMASHRGQLELCSDKDAHTYNISHGAVTELAVTATELDAGRLKPLAQHGHYLVQKIKSHALRNEYEPQLRELREKLKSIPGEAAEKLLSALNNNALLAGDKQTRSRMNRDELLSCVEALQGQLEPDEQDLAAALLNIGFRRHADAMQVWLKRRGDAPGFTGEFLRRYGIRLAVTAASFPMCDGPFTEAAPDALIGNGYGVLRMQRRTIRLDRMPAFMFVMDQMLQLDDVQLPERPWIWYLFQCVVFNHFEPLKRYLRTKAPQEAAYETLKSLFVLMDEYVWALQADWRSVPVAELLLHLDEGGITYGGRLAKQAQMLVDQGLLGRSDLGYIYDFNRRDDNRPSYIVTGTLSTLEFRLCDQPALRPLSEEVMQQYRMRHDYDPVLVHIDQQGVIRPVEKGDGVAWCD